MAVAANILTPKVQNWWATTSDIRRQKRIDKLSKELTDLNRFSHDEEVEALSNALKSFGTVGVLLILAFASAFISLFSLVSVQRLRAIIQQPEGPLKVLDSVRTTIIISTLFCLFFMYVSFVSLSGIFREARKLSPKFRNKRKKNLAAKIEALGGTTSASAKTKMLSTT